MSLRPCAILSLTNPVCVNLRDFKKSINATIAAADNTQPRTFAVGLWSVVPLRKEPNHRAEMATQLLFGELCEVLERRKLWTRIRCDHDQYDGWLDDRQLRYIDSDLASAYRQDYALALESAPTAIGDEHFQTLVMGATLPLFDGLRFQLGEQAFSYNAQAILRGSVVATSERVIKIARRYLYAPYLWGGRTPFGIDCSGFTQMVFRMFDIPLPRDASQQVLKGETIDFVNETQAGDLAFFENEKGNIIHVGIVMAEQQIIHAAAHVRIDTLDHQGIFDAQRGVYSHQLRVIKRLLPLQSEQPKTNLTPPNNAQVQAALKRQISLFGADW